MTRLFFIIDALIVELHKGEFVFLQIFAQQTDPFEGHFHSFANISFILKGLEYSSDSKCFYNI